MLNESYAIIGVTALILAVLVRILVPKLQAAENVKTGFGIGIVLFGLYTAVALLMFYHFCSFEGNGFVTGEEVFTRIAVAFLVVNIITVFAACLFFFTQEKRKLTPTEKMKLKDM